MTFIKKGVVIPLGNAGEADDKYVYMPSTIKINDKYYCYYAGYDSSNWRIMLAISEDGVNFVKKGVVIPLGNAGEADNFYVHPTVIKANDKIYCYYTGINGGLWRIMLAVSKDGMNFIKKGVVIPLGNAGEADDIYVYIPSIIRVNDKYYCYYAGYDGSNWRIMLAVSKDGMNFIKKGVVIPLGNAGEADDIHVSYPVIIKSNNKIYCYYEGFDGSRMRILLAISEDKF